MAKKVVSFALHKKLKPIKHTNKRKKLKIMLENIFNYMKSDTYMFEPFLDPQSCLTSTSDSFGEESCEPINKKEKTELLQDVGDYLKHDSYMYSPLVRDSVSDGANPPIGDVSRGEADVVARMEETTRQHGNILNSCREIEHDDIYTGMRPVVVKHKLVQNETIKHVVHQNLRSLSVPGKVLSRRKQRKIAVK